MSMLKTTVRLLVFAGIAATLWACSSANSDAPVLDSTGKHPLGWIKVHGTEYLKNRQQCSECHGSTTESSQSGGITKVSCFTASRGAQRCHDNGPAGHPEGWGAASQHGRAGAMAVSSTSSGFAYCARCHGSNFENGTARSCKSCHTKAPHPDSPWHNSSPSGSNHVLTNESNAAECAKCHAGGNNLTSLPAPPAVPAGTTPGCFNNTLCHDANVGHPVGWSDPASQLFHGPQAKASPSSSAGFSYCQKCHGTDLRGVGSAVSCFSARVGAISCHNNGLAATTPHSPSPWRSALRTHVTTNIGNANICAQCHRNGASSTRKPTTPAPPSEAAGCFNNTLCHAQDVNPPHPVAGLYLPSAQHGADAINKNNNSTGLTTCQVCHATPTTGVNPRFNVPRGATLTSGCETCHIARVAHPTPWLAGRGVTNGATNQLRHSALAAVSISGSIVTNYCVLCHGSNLDGVGGVAPTCVSRDSRLNLPGVGAVCHFNSIAVKDIQSGVFNLQIGCVSCHGNPPTGNPALGAVYPNRDNAHTEHIFSGVTCSTCHNGAGYATNLHANGEANIVLLATYQGKRGAVSASQTVNGPICLNVSCHGGRTTPPWRIGTINVDTDCTSCHELGTGPGIPEANSNFSNGPNDAGRHHNGVTLVCTTCHNTAKLAVQHFNGLGTSAFEGAAGATIGGGATSITNYNPATRSCTATCHPQPRFW